MSIFSFATQLTILSAVLSAQTGTEFEKDTLETSQGDLTITFIGHSTLMFQFGDKVVHVDPIGRYANYRKLPKADLILITHEHGDHLGKQAIDDITKQGTIVALTAACAEQLGHGRVMKNGETATLNGLQVKAVPAYNVLHGRGPGKPFHPKGVGNGYVITFGDRRIYIAGDTENIPEMAKLTDIDVAFLPMNLPYTMTPEMVVEAVRMIKPKILYPYHFGSSDLSELIRLLGDVKDVEVRIRKLG